MYFLWDITFIFFCLVFVSRTLTNYRTAGKGRGYFFWLFPTTPTRFANHSVFSVCSYQRNLMMNEDVANRSRNRTTLFYIKTSIRVNKGAGLPDLLLNISTAWKVSKYAVISGPYFPLFGLNTEIYFVNIRIQFEYRKIWTRNNSVFGHFSRSAASSHLLLP